MVLISNVALGEEEMFVLDHWHNFKFTLKSSVPGRNQYQQEWVRLLRIIAGSGWAWNSRPTLNRDHNAMFHNTMLCQDKKYWT